MQYRGTFIFFEKRRKYVLIWAVSLSLLISSSVSFSISYTYEMLLWIKVEYSREEGKKNKLEVKKYVLKCRSA